MGTLTQLWPIVKLVRTMDWEVGYVIYVYVLSWLAEYTQKGSSILLRKVR
jgi:hypothetical protein